MQNTPHFYQQPLLGFCVFRDGGVGGYERRSFEGGPNSLIANPENLVKSQCWRSRSASHTFVLLSPSFLPQLSLPSPHLQLPSMLSVPTHILAAITFVFALLILAKVAYIIVSSRFHTSTAQVTAVDYSVTSVTEPTKGVPTWFYVAVIFLVSFSSAMLLSSCGAVVGKEPGMPIPSTGEEAYLDDKSDSEPDCSFSYLAEPLFSPTIAVESSDSSADEYDAPSPKPAPLPAQPVQYHQPAVLPSRLPPRQPSPALRTHVDRETFRSKEREAARWGPPPPVGRYIALRQLPALAQNSGLTEAELNRPLPLGKFKKWVESLVLESRPASPPPPPVRGAVTQDATRLHHSFPILLVPISSLVLRDVARPRPSTPDPFLPISGLVRRVHRDAVRRRHPSPILLLHHPRTSTPPITLPHPSQTPA